MVDKINRTTPIHHSRSVKGSRGDKNSQVSKEGHSSSFSEISLLEDNLKPSQALLTLVKEKGVDFARRQLIREILLNKFGESIQASAGFQMTLEKMNKRIESIPEIKQEYDNYLQNLKKLID